MKSLAIFVLAVLFTSFANAVPYIHVQGSNFIVNGTNQRFDVIGVDYQPGGSSAFNGSADPLSDPTACLRDAILMQQLGINTIRIYNLGANLNHDECAAIFNAAGIYMILDVNSGLDGESLNRADPGSSYNINYLKHVFGVIEAFANYPNTLGFWAANEVINQQSVQAAPAYIRAVVRDMNDYISNNIGRPIGVGYSAADVDSMLSDTWNYLACNIDNSTSSKIDFFGLNDYEWCGPNTFVGSGWAALVAMFDSTTIPVIFSEFGCIKVQPRTFPEVPTLYGPQMSLLSGGLVYEWTEEVDNYGLVNLNSSSELTLLPGYSYLQQRYAAIDLASIETPNATATSASASNCASVTVTGSQFPTNFDIPARPSGVDSIITSGLTSASWWTAGSIATVSATAMPSGMTVMNYTGTSLNSNNLHLVEYACDQINAPGKAATYSYPSTTVSCAYSTTRPSGSSSSGNHNAAPLSVGVSAGEVLSVVVVVSGFVIGILAL